ncbi:hypothetical protein HBH56_083200 [Parastagonospora nodorum]|nr:hypothetical protein HBH56_083200 [Parastagonospora nodorum]KAH3982461.1 hypothetical protein HBH52_078890 [Parastagonospora nodorum]KAH4133011.1 hypothetical protein HBH47_010020 [Parastagonospora nodorum]KAH4238464.1 hypothetical protein HBI06_041880 [Parastagonospora nodorum]KAH4271336.1 hypothetical protein HBI03_037160 [Parastagonospora nodorum]
MQDTQSEMRRGEAILQKVHINRPYVRRLRRDLSTSFQFAKEYSAVKPRHPGNRLVSNFLPRMLYLH